MTEPCPHCAHEIELNFCSNCGQKRVKRIDRNYIKDDLQYTILHMNKGLPYSLKQLLKDPGGTARTFIAGDRVNHYKPILLVFVMAGIVAFLTNTLIKPHLVMEQYNSMQNHPSPIDMGSFMEIMMKYYSLIMLTVFVPFFSLVTWLTFRKWGYNYWEYIVINSYYYSLNMFFTILIILPIQFLLKDNPALFMNIPTIVSMVLMGLLYFWFFIGLFKEKAPGEVIIRSLIMMGASLGSLFVISIIAGIVIGLTRMG